MYDDTATLLPRARRVVAESRRDLGIIVTQCFLDRGMNDRETRRLGVGYYVVTMWLLCGYYVVESH